MKVVFYLDNLKSGGVQRRTMRLLKGLVDHDINRNLVIKLVINQTDGENFNLVPPSVNLCVLGNLSGKKLQRSLGEALMKANPDIVVSCMGQQFIQAVKYKFRLSKTCRWYIIQAVPVNLLANNWVSNLIRRLAMYWFYPKADNIICVSDEVKATVDNLHFKLKRKSITIYNPVVSHNLLSLANEPVTHRFFSNGNTVLVAAGRLNIQKDYNTLIKAFAKLKALTLESDFSCKLLVLGNGELHEELQALINSLDLNDDIDLVGFVDNPYKYINKADLFVMSSLWEGLPNAMIEALAIGKPIVSTDCIAGPREILKNGKFGTLVPTKNPEAFAEGILDELAKKRNVTELAERGWMFSVKNSAKKYIKLFESGQL